VFGGTIKFFLVAAAREKGFLSPDTRNTAQGCVPCPALSGVFPTQTGKDRFGENFLLTVFSIQTTIRHATN
jgi:hypothetical protein